MLLCGGLVQSDLFISTLADAVQIPIVIPQQKESVLLGSAMLGASASQYFPSLEAAMESMGGCGRSILPNIEEKEYFDSLKYFIFFKLLTAYGFSFCRFHDRKYRVFLKMVEHQKDYDNIMNGLWNASG